MMARRVCTVACWWRVVAVLMVAVATASTAYVANAAGAHDTRHTLLSADNPTRGPDTSKDLRRFVFASCSRTHLPQPWDAVAAVEPELFVWLGDIVYADVRWTQWWKPFGFVSRPLPGMARMYDKLLTKPGYHKLVRCVCCGGCGPC